MCKAQNHREPSATFGGISPCGTRVRLHDRKMVATDYTVAMFPSDFDAHGVGVTMTKNDGTTYHVFVDVVGGCDLCECVAFCKAGVCRHIDYVKMAIENNWLPGQSGTSAPEPQLEPLICLECGGVNEDPFEYLCAECKAK